jgi:Ca2+/Na+ antiporter
MSQICNLSRVLAVIVALIIILSSFSILSGVIRYLLICVALLMIFIAFVIKCRSDKKNLKKKLKKSIKRITKEELSLAVKDNPELEDFKNSDKEDKKIPKKKNLKVSLYDKPLSVLSEMSKIQEEKLKSIGILSTGDLLKALNSRTKRVNVSKKTLVAHSKLLKWANQVEFYRINGIGVEYSYLLMEAGVNTIVDFSKRNSSSLYESIKELNNKRELVKSLPSLAQIEDWQKQAKRLKRRISS